jgi:hypothetical protein
MARLCLWGASFFNVVPGKLRFDPWWVPHKGHNDVLVHNEPEFFRRMNDFLKHVDAFHNSDVAVADPSTVALMVDNGQSGGPSVN